MRTAISILSLALVSGCQSERDCSDLSCSCDAPADCPTDFACSASLCYPPGRHPLGAPCDVDDDYCDREAELHCQQGLEICVQHCGQGLPACGPEMVCQGGDCLPFGSLPLGTPCADNRLCAEGRCLYSSCAVPCTAAYSTSECPDDGTYCAVLGAVPVCVVPLPGCTPGADAGCPTPLICVEVGRGLGVCRHTCAPAFDAGGVYDHGGTGCDGQLGSFPATCAPVGENREGACVEAAPSGGLAGAACDGGSRLCARGHTCVAGSCRELCTSGSPCGGSCTEVAQGFQACL